jgi:ankyrin repeat protein
MRSWDGHWWCLRCNRLGVKCSPRDVGSDQKAATLRRSLLNWGASQRDTFRLQLAPDLLLWAAEKGYCRVIRLVLEAGVGIETKNSHGSTALHIAVRYNQTSAVQTLLIAGAKRDARTDQWTRSERWNYLGILSDFAPQSPLQLCVLFDCDLSVFRLLLPEYGPNKKTLHPLEYPESRALLTIASISKEVFTKVHEDMMKILIYEANADVDVCGKDYRTPLYMAVEAENYGAMGILLDANANPNFKDISGATPIYLASSYGDIVSLKLLLKAKGSPNGSPTRRPLLAATEWKRMEAFLELLAAGADCCVCDRNGWTALHFAASNGNVPMITALLTAGAKGDAKTSDGETPLHMAARLMLAEPIKVLLRGCSDHIANAVDFNGITPLMSFIGAAFERPTIWKSRIEGLVALLQASPDLRIMNTSGHTVLDIAFRGSSVVPDVCRLLYHAWEGSSDDWRTLPIDELKEKYRMRRSEWLSEIY